MTATTSRRWALAGMAAAPLLTLGAPVFAADEPDHAGAASAAKHTEYSFGPDSQQRLDLYDQPGLSGAPMLLYVHGGAWTLFDKSGVDALPDFARRHGFLFASTNHRLASAEKAAEDVASAVDWMLTNGPRYGGDPKRLFLIGHSSGGHLVALVSIDPRFLAAHGRTNADIAGVIGVDGAGYDAATQIHDLFIIIKPLELAMWVAAFGDRIVELSPIRQVRKDGHYPPFLLFYTNHPGGRKYNIELQAKLKEAGDTVEVVEAPGKSHFEINADMGRVGDPAGDRAAAFITTGKL